MTCNRVSIINRGCVVATNTPDNLMAQLAGGSGYDLEVEGDFETIQPLLQVLPGVKLVESISGEDLSANRIALHVMSEPAADPGRDIAAVLVGAGVGLYEMRRTRASLEDVFLELTTQENSPEPNLQEEQPSSRKPEDFEAAEPSS